MTTGQQIDCQTCRSKPEYKNRKCFNETETIVIKSKLGEKTIHRDNWTEIIDYMHALDPNYSIYGCFRHFGVCPIPIIDDRALQLWNCYNACRGLNVKTPADYYGLPAVYVDAVQIIEKELDRWQAETKK